MGRRAAALPFPTPLILQKHRKHLILRALQAKNRIDSKSLH